MRSSLPTSVLVALLTCVISCNMFARTTPVSNMPDEFYVAFPKVIHSGSSTTVWIHHKSKSLSVNDYLFNGTIRVSHFRRALSLTHFSLPRGSTKKLQVSILCLHYRCKSLCILQISLPDRMIGWKGVHVRINHPNKGEVFSRTTEMKIYPVERLVYIETDKPMYKPGDRVRFRIVSIRMDTLTESSEVRGIARGVDTPVYYSKLIVKKPSRRTMTAWINKTWKQGLEVSSLDRML